MFTYPEIDPVAFAVGPIEIHWYGLMYLAGFAVAWLGLRARARRGHGSVGPRKIDDLVFYAALGVIVGGRLGYVLFYNFAVFLDDPLSLFAVWEGGMSFHGGLLGVLVAIAIFARQLKLRFFAVTDTMAPWITPGLGFGRIGNFINGELWGRQSDPQAWWTVWVDGVPRHATQLYEAFLEGLVLFVLLWTFSLKPRPTMAVSGLFLVAYGVFRMLVEFLRLPDQHIQYLAFGWLTMGQLLSAPMVLAGAALLGLAYRRGGAAGGSA